MSGHMDVWDRIYANLRQAQANLDHAIVGAKIAISLSGAAVVVAVTALIRTLT